ncbi:MAG: hypothetical protein FWE48_05770 [Coriobacteriia bacterium]|nr:hypothetical protein [Coriobacteriia bacterium]MCL2746574.1 hypothetical protein [Coriobacteriia bacterium]MCL2871119.1 hypothetical protein [Coriobacteriia bacterium]
MKNTAPEAKLKQQDSLPQIQSAQSVTRQSWMLPGLVALLGFIASIALVMRFPPVVELEELVRLPVFHGALTWASFVLFLLLGILGLWAYFGKSAKTYSWSQAIRYSVIGLWILNFAMGLTIAALFWDFSASSQSPILYLAMEPRIRLQFAVSILGIAVLILPTIFERWRTLALFDGVYGFGTLVLTYVALSFGQSLHPSNPVMSSEEGILRYTFLLVCFALVVMCAGIVMLVRALIAQQT